MRTANVRDKAYFIYLAEMFHLDPQDKLELIEHGFLPDVLCITNSETGRSLQVHREERVVRLNYLDATNKPCNVQVYDAISLAKRTIEFLNKVTNQI